MSIANVTLLTTFDAWRGVTNQLVVQGDQLIASDNVIFNKANAAYVSANNSANNAANSANAFAVTIGAASNTWANTVSNALYPYANARANSANSYAVTVGAASNTWANTITNALYPYANGVANSANAYANSFTVNLTPANNWANTVSNAHYPYANGVANSANAFSLASLYPYANGVANSANAYAVTIGAAANTWSNTVSNALYPYANNRANSSNSFATSIGTSGNSYTIQVGAASNTWANSTFFTAANGNSAFEKANTSVQNNVTTQITVGYTVKAYSVSSNVAAYSVWRPDPANGNYQFATSNGGFTISLPMAQNCAIDILLTNGTNAKTITFSGYTAPSGGGGDTYDTTSTNKFLLMVRAINNVATYSWKALQ